MAPNSVLDGCVGIDTVLIVEVDHVDAEAPKAGLAGALDVFGAAVNVHARFVPDLTEFRCQKDVVAAPLYGLAEKLLIGTGGIGVRGIEVRYAGFKSAVDDRESHRLI